MKILFLHGWKSIPGGVKPTYLLNHGHEVINPALDDHNFEKALHTAQAEFDRCLPDVVVGSSRGGALAMNLQSGETPMVLLCPAWKQWGKNQAVKLKTIILHSKDDEIIPFAESEQLVLQSKLPAELLIEVGVEHRLADETSLAVMLWACEVLTSGEHHFWLPDQSSEQATTHEEGYYVCDACGEEIVIPLDPSEGTDQSYVEDCPVCCRANTIHVRFYDDGQFSVRAEPEQDYD